jgi:hypothetical protein
MIVNVIGLSYHYLLQVLWMALTIHLPQATEHFSEFSLTGNKFLVGDGREENHKDTKSTKVSSYSLCPLCLCGSLLFLIIRNHGLKETGLWVRHTQWISYTSINLVFYSLSERLI